MDECKQISPGPWDWGWLAWGRTSRPIFFYFHFTKNCNHSTVSDVNSSFTTRLPRRRMDLINSEKKEKIKIDLMCDSDDRGFSPRKKTFHGSE